MELQDIQYLPPMDSTDLDRGGCYPRYRIFSLLCQRSVHFYHVQKRDDTDDHIEQGWDGYHEELSSDPTFKYGLLVSYYHIHNCRL